MVFFLKIPRKKVFALSKIQISVVTKTQWKSSRLISLPCMWTFRRLARLPQRIAASRFGTSTLRPTGKCSTFGRFGSVPRASSVANGAIRGLSRGVLTRTLRCWCAQGDIIPLEKITSIGDDDSIIQVIMHTLHSQLSKCPTSGITIRTGCSGPTTNGTKSCRTLIASGRKSSTSSRSLCRSEGPTSINKVKENICSKCNRIQ